MFNRLYQIVSGVLVTHQPIPTFIGAQRWLTGSSSWTKKADQRDFLSFVCLNKTGWAVVFTDGRVCVCDQTSGLFAISGRLFPNISPSKSRSRSFPRVTFCCLTENCYWPSVKDEYTARRYDEVCDNWLARSSQYHMCVYSGI